MITIVDCGMGNLRSVQKAFEYLGYPAQISSVREVIEKAEKLVLPGDGAFGDEMKRLAELDLVSPLLSAIGQGIPFLGICVGQQVLFEESEEFGKHCGLGLFQGKIKRLPELLPVPHMGWNQLHLKKNTALLAGVESGSFVYFIHSYYVTGCDEVHVSATTDYGIEFPVVVECGNIFSTQFHPEKSQRSGLRLLKNFAEFPRAQG
jgi:imidazole glycerol-phosphate synthase subunit HisH